jgi:hypothetical protein
MIKDLPKDHKKALKFWLDFYRSHVDVLHSEDLSVKNPEMHYSQVKTRLNGSSVAVNYANVPFDVEPIESDCEAFLINSTYENYVCVNALENMENVSITVRDCMGNAVSNEVLNLSKGISVINVPKCGLVEIRK